jgi:uncharacterized protein (TIGR04255 family)
MEEMRDRQPSYAHQVFASTALELSLVQVRYPPLARFKESGYLSSLSDVLGQQYPLLSTEQAMNIVVMPLGVGAAPGGDLLRFTSIDSKWSVVLTSDFVSLETRQYSDIDEFVVRFSAVLRLVAEHLRVRYQLRFGLRYVNEFRHDRGATYAEWRELINPEFVGSALTGVVGGAVEQTISEVRTRRADGTLLLRHGFLTGTTVTPMGRAQPKSGPFYLLDLDYYDETVTEFEPGPEQRMRAYNDVLYSIFRWCIGDGEMYRVLGGTS